MAELYRRLELLRRQRAAGGTGDAGRPVTIPPGKGTEDATLPGDERAVPPAASARLVPGRAGVPADEINGEAGWEPVAPFVWRRRLEMPVDPAWAPLLGPEAAAWRYLDTETTGLSGGAGTWVFLAGWSRWIFGPHGLGIAVEQYFLADLPGEAEFLAAIEAGLGGLERSDDIRLATWNGASFDLPLLRTRWIMNGLPFPDWGHRDFIHAGRRAWRTILGDARLATLERRLVGVVRTDDVPGALVPRLYLDHIRSPGPGGFTNDLAGVFRHHAQDVVSLAAVAGLLEHLESSADGERWQPVVSVSSAASAARITPPDAGPDGLLVPRVPERVPVTARAWLAGFDTERALVEAGQRWRADGEPDWGRIYALRAKARAAELGRTVDGQAASTAWRAEALAAWLGLWRAAGDRAALIEALKQLEHREGPSGLAAARNLAREALRHPYARTESFREEISRRLARIERRLGIKDMGGETDSGGDQPDADRAFR